MAPRCASLSLNATTSSAITVSSSDVEAAAAPPPVAPLREHHSQRCSLPSCLSAASVSVGKKSLTQEMGYWGRCGFCININGGGRQCPSCALAWAHSCLAKFFLSGLIGGWGVGPGVGGNLALHESALGSGACDWPRLAMVAGAASL